MHYVQVPVPQDECNHYVMQTCTNKKNPSIDYCVHVSFKFTWLDIKEIAKSYDKENGKLFSKWLNHFPFPTKLNESFVMSHLWCLDFHNSNNYVVVSLMF